MHRPSLALIDQKGSCTNADQPSIRPTYQVKSSSKLCYCSCHVYKVFRLWPMTTSDDLWPPHFKKIIVLTKGIYIPSMNWNKNISLLNSKNKLTKSAKSAASKSVIVLSISSCWWKKTNFHNLFQKSENVSFTRVSWSEYFLAHVY